MPQDATNDGSGGPRRVAALALALGKSVPEAAGEANVDVATIYRWRRGKRFQGHVERLRARIDDQAIGRVVSAMCAAVDYIRSVIEWEVETTTNRLKAATTVLEYRVKVRDKWKMKAKMEAMQAQMTPLEALYARASGDGAQALTASDSVVVPSVVSASDAEARGPGEREA